MMFVRLLYKYSSYYFVPFKHMVMIGRSQKLQSCLNTNST